MNNQQIFDRVKNHLLTQLEPAYMPNNGGEGGSAGCMYRMYDGRSCAVGCLIPDNLYDKKMEHQSIGYAFSNNTYLKTEDKDKGSSLLVNALKSVGVTKRNLPLLDRLQKLHDGNYSLATKEEARIIYEAGLKNIARDFRLKYER